MIRSVTAMKGTRKGGREGGKEGRDVKNSDEDKDATVRLLIKGT